MIVVIKDLYTLKSWEDQDTESLAFHLNNKKIWDNCRDGLPYPYTKGNARFFIKQAQEKTDISDFCITVGGEAIGNIGFVRGTDVERFNAEVGYWISEKYWNQGIVSDAFKSRKTKCDSCEKRNAIFFAKTKCTPKIPVTIFSVKLSGRNTSVVQTPFENYLNDTFY